MPIAKFFRVSVLNAMSQSENFTYVLNLFVVHNLRMAGLANVERLALERENTEEVAADDAESRDRQTLGAVSLRKNQGAVFALCSARVVSIWE